MSDNDPGHLTSAWCNHRWWQNNVTTGGTALTPFRLWHLVAGHIDVDTGTTVERYRAGQWISAPRSFTAQTMHAGTELLSLALEWRLPNGSAPLQRIPDGVLSLGRHGARLRQLLLTQSTLQPWRDPTLKHAAAPVRDDTDHDLARATLARAGLWQIAGLLLSAYPHPRPEHASEPAIDTRVALAMRTLRQHARANFPAAHLDHATGLGRRRLEQIFIAKTGLSPRAYHTRLRLAEARTLVIQGRLSFKEIAAALDFPSAAAFTQAFIRSFGVSPSACQSQARM